VNEMLREQYDLQSSLRLYRH